MQLCYFRSCICEIRFLYKYWGKPVEWSRALEKWNACNAWIMDCRAECKPWREARSEKSLDIKVNLSYLPKHLPYILHLPSWHVCIYQRRTRGQDLRSRNWKVSVQASDFKLNSLNLLRPGTPTGLDHFSSHCWQFHGKTENCGCCSRCANNVCTLRILEAREDSDNNTEPSDWREWVVS